MQPEAWPSVGADVIANPTNAATLNNSSLFMGYSSPRDRAPCRQSQDGERLAVQLELLSRRVEELRDGAFTPFSQQPLVRAMLLPLGSFGGTALLEYLLLPGLSSGELKRSRGGKHEDVANSLEGASEANLSGGLISSSKLAARSNGAERLS
jgi:hypothetical protein